MGNKTAHKKKRKGKKREREKKIEIESQKNKQKKIISSHFGLCACANNKTAA